MFDEMELSTGALEESAGALSVTPEAAGATTKEKVSSTSATDVAEGDTVADGVVDGVVVGEAVTELLAEMGVADGVEEALDVSDEVSDLDDVEDGDRDVERVGLGDTFAQTAFALALQGLVA